MSKEQLVPKLRFEEFVYDNTWQQYKLKDVASYIRGSFPQPYTNPDFYDEENGKPFVQVADIGFNLKLNPDTKTHISKAAESKSRFVKAGKLVVALQGSIETSIGRTAITQYDAYFDRTILIFENYKVLIDKLYFAQVIKRLFEIEKENAWGATISTITKEYLNNFIIRLPRIEEQKLLGKFFTKIDAMIQLQQSKVNKVKDIKSAYLSEMFPKEGEKYPKRRFEGFTEPWKLSKVQDIFRITRGNVLSATKITEYPTEIMKYPVYSSQTKRDGLMGYYDKYLYKNAITWTTDGANAGTVSYRPGKFYCTNVSGVLISQEGYANKMVAEALNKIAWKHVSKVGNPKLMNNIMAEITLNLPQSIKEQMEIENFFNNLDNQIAVEEEKLAKLEKLKQAYLNDMFV